MKKKINIRFMIISAAAIILTAVVSTLLFYHVLKEQIFADLKAYEHVISQTDPSQLQIDSNEMRVTLVDQDGTVLYDSQADAKTMENHNDRPEIRAAREKGTTTEVRWSKTVSMHTFYYAACLENGTVLRIAKQSSSLYHVMLNTIFIIVCAACITFMLCALVSHMLTRRMVEPIERMADNMVMLDESNVYEEIRPFVAMIKEQHMNIMNHAKMRQEFTANVSHELKTPLTAISGYAELIKNGMVEEPDIRRFAGQIHKNSSRLLMLINDIIKLSELDDEDLDVLMETFDLYDLAENTIHMMEIQAEKQEIHLMLSGEHVMLHASKNLIDELIYNLVSNAVRYNVHEGKVYVRIYMKDSHPVLEVKDTGIGIPKEHQERVFERFYRVDKSRSKSTGGTGLGLAIVKHIVVQHDSSIQLESEVGEGTTITVCFPAQAD